MGSAELIDLTRWIRDEPLPIFSLLVSRNGKLVYELYTSNLERDHAHYLMSITKSVTSALVGIAIGRGLLAGPKVPVTDVLPRVLFGSDSDHKRFRRVTIKHVLGMAALDARTPPHDSSPAAVALQRDFWGARDRLVFALTQPLLGDGKHVYQYNDITPMLATGMVQYACGRSAFEFAKEQLFEPMGSRNAEWMHQDPSGMDNGGYDLRLRPIDMQKFGVLYLSRGAWRGRQIVPKTDRKQR